MSLLSLSSLKAYYGESQALFDVNLEINEGEIVALMGRNGTGTFSYTHLTLPTSDLV